MKIVVAGGTGFLGQPLVRHLVHDGHDVVVLTRGLSPGRVEAPARSVTWNPSQESASWTTEVNGADAVVNLAGESIAAKRWSTAQKQRIINSRLQATGSLVRAARHADTPPKTFVSGSAVGYYGPLGDEVVSEPHAAGSDFLGQVCQQWEAAAQQAGGAATRVVCVRTGLVVEKDGGALARMLTPFKLGVGGPLGSGRQYWPWIHRADWISLVTWTITNAAVSGAVNATAPAPVTNAAFTRALGRALHRPAFLPAPAFALRLALGEMADALLLSGQRAIPAKAQQHGFRFRYTDVEETLRSILG